MGKRPFAHAVRDAWDGIGRSFLEQSNFRIQVALGVVAIVAGAFARFAAWQWAVLALTIGAVLSAELLNTAIEHAVDLAAPAEHPKARAAKHASAGGVLIVCLAALAVGAWLFAAALTRR